MGTDAKVVNQVIEPHGPLFCSSSQRLGVVCFRSEEQGVRHSTEDQIGEGTLFVTRAGNLVDLEFCCRSIRA